jgi:cell division protein FtsZ
MEEDNIKPTEALYGGEPDISMPDIPLPAAPEPTTETNKDKCDVAFKFAFVGAGQGGSRIAEAFHRLGYRKLSAINTAQQDLNTINLDHKLCIGEGGAGKNPEVAKNKFAEHKEDVIDFMRGVFGDDFDRVFICAGAGGGTGAGTAVPLIHAAKELCEATKCPTKKVGVILALPKISEGKRVNANAHNTLKEVCGLVDEGVVSPLIILDNEKINKLYPGLAVAPFWKTANSSIAGLFHIFNLVAAKNSTFTSFDPNDYKHVLDSGTIVFGASPVEDWANGPSISKTVRDNLKNNILSGGVDLGTGTTAGVTIIGGQNVLENVPQENLDLAFQQFSRILGKGSTVHRGIYSGSQDNLTVYTAIGGLDTPHEKLEELKKLGDLA